MRMFAWMLTGALFAVSAATAAVAGVPAGGPIAGVPTMIYALGANGAVNVYDIRGNLRSSYQISDTSGEWLCGDGRDNIFVVDPTDGSRTSPRNFGSARPSQTSCCRRPGIIAADLVSPSARSMSKVEKSRSVGIGR